MTTVVGTRPAGGPGPGGGGASSPYSGIPPSPATTIGEELDWRARNLGERKVISNFDDLEFHYPADVNGHHNAIGRVEQTGVVDLLASGTVINQGTTGVWHSNFATATPIIASTAPSASNLKGAMFIGNPIVAKGVAFVQVNPAGVCVYGQSTSGNPAKTTVLRQCIFTDSASGSGAGVFDTFLAPITMEACQLLGTTGFLFTLVASLARFLDCVGSNLSAGAVMFTIDGSAIVAGGYKWDGCTMITNDSTQRMIRIDPGSVLPGNEFGLTQVVGIRLTSCDMVAVNPVDTGRIMDATGVDEKDQRIWATGNLYGTESLILGQCEFLTTGVPIVKTYDATDTFEIIPFTNGSGGSIVLDAVSQRFDLVTPMGTTAASVNAGGSYAPDGVGLAATQASTSGTGTGASFTVTIAGGVVTTVDSIVTEGEGYSVGDTITITVAGEIVAAVLDVDTVSLQWWLRFNGPIPTSLDVDYDISCEGTAGASLIQTRGEWRQGALDPWVDIGGSTALASQVNNVPVNPSGKGTISTADSDAHIRVTISNSSTVATDVLAISVKVKS